MPRQQRAQAPLGRLLQWHQLKLVGGLLIAAVPFGTQTTIAAQLLTMPPTQITEILDNAQALAKDLDCLKQHGLYADIDDGRVRLPSQVTETEVPAQLARARLAASSASVLLDPGVQARLVHPPAEIVEFCGALISALAEAGYSRTPEAAAQLILETVGNLQEQAASSRAR